MDLKIFMSVFSILYSVLRLITADSHGLSTESFGNVKEDYALDLPPTQSSLTDGLFECALICLRLLQCYYLNYQISLERSGLCEVFKGYLTVKELDGSVLERSGFAFVQKLLLPRKSCLEYLQMGTTKSGIFKILDEESKRTYNVYCDFTSDPGMAWTLVTSDRIQRPVSNPLFVNRPVDEENPNWIAYRLSLNRMDALKKVSTHWRITCNFPDGVDHRDYVRAKFSDIDMIHFVGKGLCRKVEYINIRGYNCSSCTVAWWQTLYYTVLHNDNTGGRCEIRLIPGSVSSEDNFGYYNSRNAAFRCTKDPESTTNRWIGGYA